MSDATEGGQVPPIDEIQVYRAFRNKLIEDRTRPTYHLINPEGPMVAPGDPNGAIFWKGRYHLHFIFPGGYAHVSSIDMVHWRWHPMTQLGSGRMNSGGCFVNSDGVPTMIYNDSGHGNINHLAFARDDDLEQWSEAVRIEWTTPEGVDGSKISNWDPDGWVEGDTNYALFGRHPFEGGTEATLLKSKDLKHWEIVGPFMRREMPDVAQSDDIKINEDVSCPTFFKLGARWVLLCISHNKGCRYYLGDWKDQQFTPDVHARMNWCLSDGMQEGDHGGEFFAPESLLTPDGRRVMWAWCFASSKSSGNDLWDGIQSLPRELSLPEDGVLRIAPLRELRQLRYNPVTEQGIVVKSGAIIRLKQTAGDTLEMIATFTPGKATRFGVIVLCDGDNKGLEVEVDSDQKTLRVGNTAAPFEPPLHEDVQLNIFVDRRVVEVFANTRQAVVKQHNYAPGDVGVCLYSEGGDSELRELQSWAMAASNAW